MSFLELALLKHVHKSATMIVKEIHSGQFSRSMHAGCVHHYSATDMGHGQHRRTCIINTLELTNAGRGTNKQSENENTANSPSGAKRSAV